VYLASCLKAAGIGSSTHCDPELDEAGIENGWIGFCCCAIFNYTG